MKVTVRYHLDCLPSFRSWFDRLTLELGKSRTRRYEQELLDELKATVGKLPGARFQKSTSGSVQRAIAVYNSTLLEYQIKKRTRFFGLVVDGIEIIVTRISELPPDVLPRLPRP